MPTTTNLAPASRREFDNTIPFPAPAGGACWPPRRCSVPLELVAAEAERLRAERLNELACAAEAMDAGDSHALPTPRHAFISGREVGERYGYRRGWAWGLVCGITLTIGIGATVVLVSAAVGYDSVPQIISRLPAVET